MNLLFKDISILHTYKHILYHLYSIPKYMPYHIYIKYNINIICIYKCV